MAEREKGIRRDLLVVGVASVFTILGSVITHYLDRRNWTSEHREEKLETRRHEMIGIMDTTVLAFGRVNTTTNALFWGLQGNVASDSIAKLAGAYDRDIYAFESQGPRLEALIKVYFDNATLRQFTSVMGATEALEAETASNLRLPKGRRVDATKLREFGMAVLTLGDHMAQQIVPDTTR